MTVSEFQKKGFFSTTYGLFIQSTLTTENPIDAEFRHIKEALLDWSSRRGRRAGFVLLNLLAPVPEHEQLKQFMRRVYDEEVEVGPLLQRLKFKLCLLSEHGRPKDELSFNWPAGA